jgi:integrase
VVLSKPTAPQIFVECDALPKECEGLLVHEPAVFEQDIGVTIIRDLDVRDSVCKAHDRVCEDMGMRGVMDLYNLRHTFATRSILSGTDVTILQKILGHSEIGMTMRYVKIAEHYKVEAVERLEKYRAVQMQEVEKRLGMIQ